MNKTPQRNAAQTKGDIGETAVQLIFRKFGWAADIISSDYGEDLDCNIFINSQRTNLHFRCQVKSRGKGSTYVKELKSNRYSVSIETSILQTWMTCMFPIFLIVYDEETESMFWSIPVQQSMKTPEILSKNSVSIHVEKQRKFTTDSRDEILREVQLFYNQLLRLHTARIECQIIPVIMPKYRVFSPYRTYELIGKNPSSKLTISPHMLDSEMLPSWTTVLQRLDAQPYITSIRVNSDATDLEQYLNLLHEWLGDFKFDVAKQEWISFIITPIKIITDDGITSSWLNELTYWTSYSLINGQLVADYDYAFAIEGDFISPVARRARSWEYYHKIDLKNDVAVDFYGSLNISPAVKSLNVVHARNIDWQYILWICMIDEIELIQRIITEDSEEEHEKFLVVKILEEKSDGSVIIVIANSFFDPFMGLYSSPMSWEDFDNDIVTRLKNNGKLELLPGNIYEGEVPQHFKSAVGKFERTEVKYTTIREYESVPGFPIRHSDRLIHVIRFQMLDKATFQKVENNFLKVSKEIEENKIFPFSDFTFALVDDSWREPIFELSASWRPEINQSSNISLKLHKEQVLEIFNSIMPPVKKDYVKKGEMSMKNTLEILSLAGEIHFEKEIA
ncbi:MAG: DUF4365 domain-containing protein [Agriterribacter sp.]